MSAGLAAQQQALLSALWEGDPETAMHSVAQHARQPWTPASNHLKRGLQAYRSHGLALAGRVLDAAFPVLAQLLGEDNFGALARAFWRSHPPQGGDLAQWGGALPAFVGAAPQLADEPYLGDVARVEWALHQAASAADTVPDLASLALLTSHDPAALRLRLSAGVACVASAWPVVSIVQAHRTGEPTLAQAGQRLRDGAAETALVWREGLQPRLREALPGEPELISALLAGEPLLPALGHAPALDITAWLSTAAPTGLLAGVQAV